MGLLNSDHKKLAVVFPTSNDHGSHGCVVTAMASQDLIVSSPI